MRRHKAQRSDLKWQMISLMLAALVMSGCASSGTRIANKPLCEEQPPGAEVGVATTDEPFICIPSQPNNNNATCKQFEDGLKDRVATTAAGTCVRVKNLQCINRDCKTECLPAATIVASSLVLDKNYQGCPNPANEDACRLLSIIAACDCVCPEDVTP